MTRPFTADEVQQMRKLVGAVLPEGCSVQAAMLERGWKVSMVICGRTDCMTYEIQPPLDRGKLVVLAEAWETGKYVAPKGGPPLPVKPYTVETDADFIRWVRGAQHGQRAVYFDGSVAHFRQEASVTLRKLQAVADTKRGSYEHRDSKAGQINRLQARLDLLNAVERLRAAGLVELVQQRKPGGDGAVYFAVRR